MSEPNIMRCRRTGQGVCVKIGGGSCVCATVDECTFRLVKDDGRLVDEGSTGPTGAPGVRCTCDGQVPRCTHCEKLRRAQLRLIASTRTTTKKYRGENVRPCDGKQN